MCCSNPRSMWTAKLKPALCPALCQPRKSDFSIYPPESVFSKGLESMNKNRDSFLILCCPELFSWGPEDRIREQTDCLGELSFFFFFGQFWSVESFCSPLKPGLDGTSFLLSFILFIFLSWFPGSRAYITITDLQIRRLSYNGSCCVHSKKVKWSLNIKTHSHRSLSLHLTAWQSPPFTFCIYLWG